MVDVMGINGGNAIGGGAAAADTPAEVLTRVPRPTVDGANGKALKASGSTSKLSAGDYQRLQRMKQLKSAVDRRRGVTEAAAIEPAAWLRRAGGGGAAGRCGAGGGARRVVAASAAARPGSPPPAARRGGGRRR